MPETFRAVKYPAGKQMLYSVMSEPPGLGQYPAAGTVAYRRGLSCRARRCKSAASNMEKQQSARSNLSDAHVRCFAGLMFVLALPLVLMLVLSPIAAVRLAFFDPPIGRSEDALIAAVVLPIGFALGVYGVALLVIAVGLFKRRRWAGYWGAAVALTWFPLGLVPFGAYGLFALLRKRVRADWLERPGRRRAVPSG